MTAHTQKCPSCSEPMSLQLVDKSVSEDVLGVLVCPAGHRVTLSTKPEANS
jgi:uncharacterized protein YbaR (Trm112 family)